MRLSRVEAACAAYKGVAGRVSRQAMVRALEAADEAADAKCELCAGPLDKSVSMTCVPCGIEESQRSIDNLRERQESR